MKNKEAKDLLKKYTEGTANEYEMAQIESWYLRMQERVKSIPAQQIEDDELASRLAFEILYQKTTSYNFFKSFAIAASIVIIAGIGILFYLNNSEKLEESGSITYVNHIKPGRNTASLILENGKKIELTSVRNGVIAIQSGIKIIKTAEGELIYSQVKDNIPAKDSTYNTLETPRGGQYKITLPDGTKVWMNAASTLKFPVRFKPDERKLNLKGEAYFEVAKNKHKPFRLITAKQDIEVLGTHFNVNSYPEEKFIKTTLLEGSVKVRARGTMNTEILLPGQQALQKGSSLYTKATDIEEVVSWKNGYFKFNEEQIESIMRKISRWYNVEIYYKGDVNRSENFSGTVSRYDNVSKVLEKLALTGAVHFKVEGRRITVLK